MIFFPGEVVVVVNFFHNVRLENLANYETRNVFTASVGVPAAELHGGKVVLTDRRVERDDRWRNVHAVFAAGNFQEVRGRPVAESTRTEVHADPDDAVFVGENIHVVVAAADCAELLVRHVFELADFTDVPRFVVEQVVIDLVLVRATDTERDVANHVVHDRGHLWFDVGFCGVGADGEVAARDVETDARDRYLVLIRDYAADWLGVALVSVGAENGLVAARRQTRLNLLDRRFVVLTKNHRGAFHFPNYNSD